MIAAGPPRLRIRWERLFILLAMAVAVSALPALKGGWVYDDRLLPGNPLLDGVKDVLGAFTHNSADYMARAHDAPVISGSVTYRPIPMLLFALTNATAGPRPWAHHLVSLLLHLVAVALLCRLAARDGRVGVVAATIAALFALHPALTEAYQWVNGRSDVLAGLTLLLVARLLFSEGGSRWRGVSLFAVFLFGALSKETFLAAGAGLVAASAYAGRAASVPRPMRAALSASALAVAGAVFLAARFFTLHGPKSSAAPEAAMFARWLLRAPRLVALCMETLLVPLPRPMRTLAWELAQPWPVGQLLLLFALALLVGWLVFSRRFFVLALLGGAILCLLPVGAVADSLWLGLDRYLYLPACLTALAVLPAAVAAEPPRGSIPIGLLVCGWLFFTSFSSAGAYRSHREFCTRVLEARPEDASGYILLAREALDQGRPDSALGIMRHVPTADLPPPLAHDTAATLLSVGQVTRAAAIVEQANAEHPEDPNLRFDLLALRGGQHRWDEAARLAVELARDPRRRDAVEQLVRGWLADDRVPDGARVALREAL